MTKQKIIVGRIYKNKQHSDALYLGITVKRWPSEEKSFVIIDCEKKDKDLVGRIVVEPEINLEFWANFVLTKKKLRIA